MKAKLPFRVRPYRGHSSAKFVVRAKIGNKWTRKYFRTEAEAKTYAQQRNNEALSQGIESVEFPTDLRVMAQKCQTKLEPFGKTLDHATEHYLAFLKATSSSTTAGALVAELIASRESDVASRRYLDDLKMRLGRFAKSFEGVPVAVVMTAEIDNWLRNLRNNGKPISPTSRNNFRRVLTTTFNFAKRRGYVVENPAAKTTRAKEIDEAPGILTVEEAGRLLEAAREFRPEALPFLALGCFAGLRSAELARLEWENLDFEAGLIEVPAKKSKTARRRFVKIQPNLSEWLTPYQLRKGPVAPRNLRRMLAHVRKVARLAEWPPNALRHSFASYHLAHFQDAARLALEMGHTNSAMIFDHYRQLVKPKEAKRFWKITPYVSGESGEKLTYLPPLQSA